MMRLSIARSLRLALVGLTVALTVLVAIGISGLYRAREDYEQTLLQTSSLSSSAANVSFAALALDARTSFDHNPGHAVRIAESRRAYAAAIRTTADLARDDPPSRRLTERIKRTANLLGTISIANQLEERQQTRRRAAQRVAHARSNRALTIVIAAGAIALLAAAALIALVIRGMRRPLDALVDATRRIAAGDLEQRVQPAGPSELRALGQSFNAMATDLELSASRLIEARERLAVTIESLGDGLLVSEPGSDRIAMANPRAVELLPELAPGTRAEESPAMPLTLPSPTDGETTFEHHGRILAVTAATVGAAAGDGTVWTVRDVTEQARLERAKSEFVATASHELRSPLTSIKGFVELLAASPGGMSDRQREFVEIILRSTDRLSELVADLLDVARLEADHVEIAPRPVDLGEIVVEVVELIGPRVAAKQQEIHCDIAAALPAALADPGRLRQIVANLVTNAHLYTPEGGRIDVSVDADPVGVRLSVRDNGVGMSAEQQERVFDRFYRAIDDRSAPGTGLGLSIVRALIELHGGTIDVESEPDAGTTFVVRLPAAGAAQSSPSLDVLAGRRVLIVEEDPATAALITEQLSPFGTETTRAAGAEEAMTQLRSGVFDVVTLDVQMSGSGGVALLAQIRALPGLERMPVVFISAAADAPEIAGEWLVSKPIDHDALRSTVAAAVRAGRTRVLVVARAELRGELEPPLRSLRVAHRWELSGVAAAKACREQRFEVALVDVGLPNPQAILRSLDLRGRRVRRAVLVFRDGLETIPAEIERLGLEVVAVDELPDSLVAAIHSAT